MNIFLFFLIFIKSTYLYASVDLSTLPSQESIRNILSEFSGDPKQYLPQYNDNVSEIDMVDNHALIETPNLQSNEMAQIINQSYQNNEDLVGLFKQFRLQEVNNELPPDFKESLTRKYYDYQYSADAENFNENDFKQATTNLAVVSEAAHQAPGNLNEHAYTIFQGKSHKCRKYGFGYLNCCDHNGWGQFVSQCNREEVSLSQAREKGTVIFLGTKKSGSKLKKKKHDVYCVFESKLARIIQEQGRFSQLHLNFGNVDTPNCRGISASELSRINLDYVNLSEIYPDIKKSINSLDEKALSKQARQKIEREAQKVGHNA